MLLFVLFFFLLLRTKSIQSFRIVTFCTLELLATTTNRERSRQPQRKMRTSTYSEQKRTNVFVEMNRLSWSVALIKFSCSRTVQ